MDKINRAKRDIQIIQEALGKECIRLKESEKRVNSRTDQLQSAISYLANIEFEVSMEKEMEVIDNENEIGQFNGTLK